jgi:hypothetical protein
VQMYSNLEHAYGENYIELQDVETFSPS